MASSRQQALIHEIVTRQIHRHTTAAVLLHQAAAERLGLGPTDHKVFDLLHEHGPMSGSDLAALTGLTSGAMTGVIARLEQAGWLRRESDPLDRRRQILTPEISQVRKLHAIFHPLHQELAAVLEGFDAKQLEAIIEFLKRGTDLIYMHASQLRSHALSKVIHTNHRSTEEAVMKKIARKPTVR